MLQNLLKTGYYYFKDPGAFQFIDIDAVDWGLRGLINLQKAQITPDLELAINATQRYLGEKYIRPSFGNYYLHYCDVLNGLDDDVLNWHQDSEPNKEKIGILLYFSDLDKDTGGSLEIRNAKTKEETGVFYPNVGDVCILHHTPNFEHRVSRLEMKVPRIVIIFHYYVVNLLC
jgi:hypothetical protein